MTITFNNNVVTPDVLTTILNNRLAILKEVITENKHLKLFDNDVFDLIINILACFNEFCTVCEHMNIIIRSMSNITDKNKLHTYEKSSYCYLDDVNNKISKMVYLTKKLNMMVKPKYFNTNANILFDYDLTFSYDNLRDVSNVAIIDYSTISNVSLMKLIYKAYDDKFT